MTQQLERRDPTQEDEDENDEMKVEESAEEDDTVSESEDDEDEEEEPDLELRSKIEEALRASGIEPADGSEGEDDSEEEVMDDDQMMAIDDQLAEIFRSRANERKGGKGRIFPSRRCLFVLIRDSPRCQCAT
jgi:DNA polymerase phi